MEKLRFGTRWSRNWPNQIIKDVTTVLSRLDNLKGKRIIMLLDNACNPDPRVNREAESLSKIGAHVEVWCWIRDSPAPMSELVNNVHIRRYPPTAERKLGARQFYYLLKFYKNVLRSSAEIQADIIVAHDYLMLPLGVILARKLRAKLVYDAHEVYRWMEAGRLPQIWLRLSEALETSLVRRYVDLFITVSQQRRDDYWRKKRSLDPIIVGNWYDKISADRESVRRKYGIPLKSTRVIGYAGSISSIRPLDSFVNVGKSDPSITVVIAGRGDNSLIEPIKTASNDYPNIIYLGWVDDSSELLASCDAIYYVLDPEHPYAKYAAPNTLYTAIAANRPLLAVAGGEVEYIARETGAVLLADRPTKQLLVEQIDRIDSWSGWGGVGLEYTWAKAEKVLVEAYSCLLQEEISKKLEGL